MPNSGSPGAGTMIIIALLLLGLAFAGSWIVTAVTPGGDPYALIPWFGTAAGVIIALALFAYVRSR
jgi:hypothetical protein